MLRLPRRLSTESRLVKTSAFTTAVLVAGQEYGAPDLTDPRWQQTFRATSAKEHLVSLPG